MNVVARPINRFDLYPLFGDEERTPLVDGAPQVGVVHITVSPNFPGLGDITNVASYLDRVGLEIHAMVDKEANMAMSLVPSGPRKGLLHLAQYDHARGVNDRAIGIEVVSYLQPRAEWWEDSAQIEQIARFMAYCREDQAIRLPLRHLTLQELAAGKRGWIGHYQVPGTDHTDPGPGFPLTYCIETMACTYWSRGWQTGGNAVVLARRPEPVSRAGCE